jgi:hypothetical protein
MLKQVSRDLLGQRVIIFIDATTEYSSASEHLDENPKVYLLFVVCDLPFHVIFVIVNSRVKFLRRRFIACLLVNKCFSVCKYLYDHYIHHNSLLSISSSCKLFLS